MRLAGERFARLTSNQEVAPAEFALLARGRQVVAVAGIGYPPRFFEHLSALGVVARTHAFPDHHQYQASDLRFPGAEIIVMTEKDAVKCAAFADARMWYLSVDAQLPREFHDFLLARIAQARPKTDGSQAA
jgi:tetraacyldisaccharide 4'-kinase